MPCAPSRPVYSIPFESERMFRLAKVTRERLAAVKKLNVVLVVLGVIMLMGISGAVGYIKGFSDGTALSSSSTSSQQTQSTSDCTTQPSGWQWQWIGYGAAQPKGVTRTDPHSYAGYCISSLPFALGTYTPERPGVLAVTYSIQGSGVSSYTVVMLYTSPQVVVEPLDGNGTTVASIRPIAVSMLTPLSSSSKHDQTAIPRIFTMPGVTYPIIVGDSAGFGLPCSYSDIQDAVMGARALNHC